MLNTRRIIYLVFLQVENDSKAINGSVVVMVINFVCHLMPLNSFIFNPAAQVCNSDVFNPANFLSYRQTSVCPAMDCVHVFSAVCGAVLRSLGWYRVQ